MSGVRTKGPYHYTPTEHRLIERWFAEVREAAGDPTLTEREILLLYAADPELRPRRSKEAP